MVARISKNTISPISHREDSTISREIHKRAQYIHTGAPKIEIIAISTVR